VCGAQVGDPRSAEQAHRAPQLGGEDVERAAHAAPPESTPESTAATASATESTPLTTTGPGQGSLSQVTSAGRSGANSDTIPSAAANLKGIAVQFGGGPAIDDWYETQDLVSSGQLDPTPLIGEVVSIDGLADAFVRARSSSASPRIVFVNEQRPVGAEAQ
jgi:threonine dehydrogenase-like Zn-dependent dehydrogenase